MLIAACGSDADQVTAADATGTTAEATTTTAATTTTTSTTTTTTIPPTTTTTIPPTTTTMAPLPGFVLTDCIAYDVATLVVEDLGDDGWRLDAGASALLLYDTEKDALRGLAVAQNHTELCFIGRGAQPYFVHEFWHGDSGEDVDIPRPEDCLRYDPTNLTLTDLGDGSWRLVDGDHWMAIYRSESDALAGLTVAEARSQYCFIGRDNSRPDRDRYIREYWK
jgi:hypothetical protein